MASVINNTSVDDIRSSLNLMNPIIPFDIREDIDYLRRSLNYEVKNQNRSTVIKMLQVKLRKIEKRRQKFLIG
jgi:hypothetical protein